MIKFVLLISAPGTMLLFWGSFTYETMTLYDDCRGTYSKALTRRNNARQLRQRIGLGLLLASFFLQSVAIV